MSKKSILLGFAAIAVVLAGIQVIPATAVANPPVEEEVAVSPEVMQLLRRSCYDCHSNETVWPWYSHLAPAKWLVRHDVVEGREHLNFSTWNRYDAEERAEKWEEIAEEMEERKMPPWFYLPLHPHARLSAQEATLLRRWADTRAGEGALREQNEHQALP